MRFVLSSRRATGAVVLGSDPTASAGRTTWRHGDSERCRNQSQPLVGGGVWTLRSPRGSVRVDDACRARPGFGVLHVGHDPVGFTNPVGLTCLWVSVVDLCSLESRLRATGQRSRTESATESATESVTESVTESEDPTC